MEKGKRFLGPLFGFASGDKVKGAQYMAKHQITQEDIRNISEEEIQRAFEEYKTSHAALGIDYSDSLEEFKKNLVYNLDIALNYSYILFADLRNTKNED